MKHKIEIEFDDSVSPLMAGFRTNWVNGEDKHQRVNLSCGAGTGSPFMIFSSTDKKTNKRKYAVADIRPLVHKLGQLLK